MHIRVFKYITVAVKFETELDLIIHPSLAKERTIFETKANERKKEERKKKKTRKERKKDRRLSSHPED